MTCYSAVVRLAAYTLVSLLSLGVAGYALGVYSLLPPGAMVHPAMRTVFESHRIGLYSHIFGAVLTLLLGPLQFSTKLHARRPSLHRMIGRVYLGVGVLVGGLGGLFMAMFAYGGPVSRTGFAVLAVIWLYTGARALLSARTRRFAEHRAWMFRNYALAFAAVTLRIELGVATAAGVPFDTTYRWVAWVSWIPNLLLAEWIIQSGADPPGTRQEAPTVAHRLWLPVGVALAVLASTRPVIGQQPAPQPSGPSPGRAPVVEGTRVMPGSPLPAMPLRALLPGAKDPTPLDLGPILGRRPVLFCYLTPGEPRGEDALRQAQEAARGASWAGKVEVLGAVRLGRMELPQVVERLAKLKAEIPVIVEEGFSLGAALGMTTSPSLSLVDASGILRIADAKSLHQEVASGMTLRQAAGIAASGGPVPTVERLARYYPAAELVGSRLPDFSLPRLGSAETLRLSETVRAAAAQKKFVALFFWHPDCKPCTSALPGIVTGLRTYVKSIDLVSVAAIANDDEERKAAAVMAAQPMSFPVLEDEGRRVSDLYKVISVPTMFFIRPDGMVDSVYTAPDVNYLPVFSAKLRSILGTPSSLVKPQ